MADDEKVGYRRPPKKSRFKPGQSGNPKGRPKGTKNLKRDLIEELQELESLVRLRQDRKLEGVPGPVALREHDDAAPRREFVTVTLDRFSHRVLVVHW